MTAAYIALALLLGVSVTVAILSLVRLVQSSTRTLQEVNATLLAGLMAHEPATRQSVAYNLLRGPPPARPQRPTDSDDIDLPPPSSAGLTVEEGAEPGTRLA